MKKFKIDTQLISIRKIYHKMSIESKVLIHQIAIKSKELVHQMTMRLKILWPNIKTWSLRQIRTISWKSPKVLIGSLTVVLLIASGTFYLNTTTSAAYLILNGEKIGLVNSVQSGQQLVEDILNERGQAIGKPANTHDVIEFEAVRVNKTSVAGDTTTQTALQTALTSYIQGYTFEVNGTQIALLLNEDDTQKLLKAYQDFYTKPSNDNQLISAEFSETIVSKPVEVLSDQVQPFEKVLQEVIAGKTITTEYTVQPNDSLWLIARKNDMKTLEVVNGNPGMTEDTAIKVGQKINLVTVSPYLTCKSTGILTATETIPFDVVSSTDTKLSVGETVVKQQGSDGSKVVKYSYEQQNGKNITKVVLEEQVTQQPVNQVVAKGPNRITVVASSTSKTVSRGSGSISGIAWPLGGNLTSYYGYRGGGFHSGLDIDGETGDPFSAAASGTVAEAGWQGGYGYMILIDHGNGVMTRYAHASKLYVSSGQSVNQGQVIGLVGSTGNSTGSHLHFEVIINGDTTNPLSYLR